MQNNDGGMIQGGAGVYGPPPGAVTPTGGGIDPEMLAMIIKMQQQKQAETGGTGQGKKGAAMAPAGQAPAAMTGAQIGPASLAMGGQQPMPPPGGMAGLADMIRGYFR